MRAHSFIFNSFIDKNISQLKKYLHLFLSGNASPEDITPASESVVTLLYGMKIDNLSILPL